ncbi:hypothetical protein PF005_g26282 [Phytophthora fragariae]|uniref:Uncharacterized protein n=1 Tax=Phytophthora fragariae TaxID=53985 RepID=A0A6A3R1C0_9STRA|nr:hypothetical protein PF009_g18923 [Phytophthora fragariae]KAE8994625.1 hypothetical protein PF011_g16656 [Phytophthora fragariae]KAE9087842.1 hypothetical protein PF006_g25712 [Phytophthora fragariae]KAE9094100.1 hypothetical protein PF010_g17231 [Phytophthora fragariae]KAE9094133.1 hypothetical protein PF007_g17865 [Phytophthora fragariae]
MLSDPLGPCLPHSPRLSHGLRCRFDHWKQPWHFIKHFVDRAPGARCGEDQSGGYNLYHTSCEESISAAVEQLKGQLIDVLIHDAGIGGREGIDKMSKSEMMKQFTVNAVDPFLMTRVFLPVVPQ